MRYRERGNERERERENEKERDEREGEREREKERERENEKERQPYLQIYIPGKVRCVFCRIMPNLKVTGQRLCRPALQDSMIW